MKQNYINAVALKLIDNKGYMPFKDENGNITYNEQIKVLYTSSYGSLTIIELLDGDTMEASQIEEKLLINQNVLANMSGANSYTYFPVFVFEKTPDAAKITAIKEGQSSKVMNKRYLSCLTVDLSAKNVEKHFSLPKGTMGLERLLMDLLNADMDVQVVQPDIDQVMKEKTEAYSMQLSADKPWVTYLLIAINVVVWGLLTLLAAKTHKSYVTYLDIADKDNALIMAGSLWRFVTPIFLHADIIHLLVNCYSLYALGGITERMYGHTKFIIVYLIAGILGNIASFMFSPHNGVGASGSIFGLMGALLYFGAVNPVLFRRYFGYDVIVTLAINVYYGFSHSGIDNYAHMGGLVGGFLASGIVKLQSEPPKKYLNRMLFAVLTILLTTGSLYYGFNNSQNTLLVKTAALEKMVDAGDWAGIQRTGEEIMKSNPKGKEIRLKTLWALIIAEASQGNYNKAVEYAKAFTELDPPRGHYLLGALYADSGQNNLAIEELETAKKLDSSLTQEVDRILAKLVTP